MKLDPALWTALEEHGLSEAHLAMLLRALETQRNGSLAWHFAHGRMTQADLRLVFPARRDAVSRVSEAVLADGNSLLR